MMWQSDDISKLSTNQKKKELQFKTKVCQENFFFSLHWYWIGPNQDEKSAMDVINKLYSSVSNTVSQISSALPGNPVSKEFDTGEHIASAGPGNIHIEMIKSLESPLILWSFYRIMLESVQRNQALNKATCFHICFW